MTDEDLEDGRPSKGPARTDAQDPHPGGTQDPHPGGTHDPHLGADLDAAQDSNPDAAQNSDLDDRARAVLRMERHPWPTPGAKERAIREELAMSPTRYYQLLNTLLDDTRALAHDPVTVNRLRRLREEQRDRR